MRASTGSIPNKTSSNLKPTKPSQTGSSSKTSPSMPTANSSTPKKQTPRATGSKSSMPHAKAGTPQKPPPKRHLDQLKMVDMPDGFEPTKNCFFVFIRIIWGLVLVSAVPKPPSPALMAKFNAHFSDVSDINRVLDSPTAQDLVERNQVVTLADARAGRMKIGCGIVNIKEFFVMYSQAMFAKLGIRVWGPDLDAADDSLWNEVCRISAIHIFRQWVAADTFAYMNINKKFTNDILLLERTYNHYVHYWMAQKYRRESKEEGANQAADDIKNVQTNQRRLRNSRYDHAIKNKFPERYLKMLSPIEAHSDDEQCPKLKGYIVKTPIYCSIKAGIFMHRLDDHMFKSAQLKGCGQSKLRRHLRPKKPIESTFTKPPTGLPIDFYNADWFNNTLSISQRCDIADIDNVMFLPNPQLSHLGKTHPDEKLKDNSFTRKHWAEGSKDYNLDFLTTPEDEEGEDEDKTDEDNESYHAGSIDLEDTDGEDYENEDECESEMGEDNIDKDEDVEDEGAGDLEPFDKDMNDDWENARIEGNDEGFKETFPGKGEHFIVDQDMYDDSDEARALRWDAWADA